MAGRKRTDGSNTPPADAIDSVSIGESLYELRDILLSKNTRTSSLQISLLILAFFPFSVKTRARERKKCTSSVSFAPFQLPVRSIHKMLSYHLQSDSSVKI